MSMKTKYIDAEKLYKEIDGRMVKFAELETEAETDDMSLTLPTYYQGKRKMCSEILTLIDSLQQEQPEPYFYCKYGGTIPLCSDCKRNHNNSSFKTEEITTWYAPSNGTKHCIDYIQRERQDVDVVSAAKVFLDALSKTPYNNKPITDAQIIVKQLLLFFENPKEYNPDAILEQPKVDLVTELKHHLATTPKEQLEKEWKELEPWGNIGPTVQEFLYGKQSEVDLEKEE